MVIGQKTIKKRHRKKQEEKFSEGLEIVIARSLDEIETIRPIWEQMQGNEPCPAINADIDRYLSVVEVSGNDVQPYIMVIKQHSHAEAMLIGRLENHPVKLKLGYKTLFSPTLRCLSVVYGGIIGQPRSDLCVVLIGELMKALRHREVDVVYFNHLRTDSYIYQLSRKLPGILSRGYFPRVETHWSISIPESMDLFYKRFSSKGRSELRRYIRKLEKAHVVRIASYNREEDLEDVIKVVCQISVHTYQHAMAAGFVDNALTRNIMKTTAQKGWLRCHVLFVDGDPVAFQLGFQCGKIYFADQIGFDPSWRQARVGTVLLLKVLEELCNEPEVDTFDFGFGDAHYKQLYCDKNWTDVSFYIFAPCLYPMFVNMLRTCATGLNTGLEYILNKTGLTGWIKRRWRNSLQVTKNNKHKTGAHKS